MDFSEKVKTAQAITTIIAIIVGGYWTYSRFISARGHFPHANIKHEVSHIQLSDSINLLRVAVVITNTGKKKITLERATIWVQQIMPIVSCSQLDPCAKDQINRALREDERQNDRFSWPLISKRYKTWKDGIEIEPGETDEIDFEFAIPSEVTNSRIYTYFYNKKKTKKDAELGWSKSSFYKL